jgi:23S rRNA (guanosine2251-2'-O)-methyltransferase
VYIFGRNAVAEALKAGRAIEKILIQYGADTAPMQALRLDAERKRIPVSTMDKGKFQVLEREVCGQNSTAQGVIALAAVVSTLTVGALLEQSFAAHDAPLLVALDSITDPHNVGAIARSAECAGFQGMIVPEQKSAPLGGAALKVSAGALEHIPVARTSNLAKALEDVRNAGFTVLALEMKSDTLYTEPLYDDATVIVIGSEGAGISAAVRRQCTGSVGIPLHGRIASLNASVAASLVMFEVVRQRGVASVSQTIDGTLSS